MIRNRFSAKFSVTVACMVVISLLAFTPAFAGDELSREVQTQASQNQPASVSDVAEGAASVEAAGAAGATGLMTTNALVVGGAVFGTAAVLGVATSAASDTDGTGAHTTPAHH
ncbi:MAG: hypothetical protein K9L59_19855 [Desulfobacterales bacterium]|nr:hypothetical protein [Desulfobacterales bacterium]